MTITPPVDGDLVDPLWAQEITDALNSLVINMGTGASPISRIAALETLTAASLTNGLESAWTTWTPTYTNLTIGSGTTNARYKVLGNASTGKTVLIYWDFTFGSGSAVGTAPAFTIPINARTSPAYTTQFPMSGSCLDAGITRRQLSVGFTSPNSIFLEFWNATPAPASITSTAPFTWGTGDQMAIWGLYEIA